MSERIVCSDASDEATKTEERDREQAIERALSTSFRRLTPVGECHNCGTGVAHPKLFCDRECADEHADFERRGLV